MNYLYSKVNWHNIEYVGFDMDGTLYDEFDFIMQAYSEISKLFSNNYAKEYMLNRWLEKGSSYNKIFDETYELFYLDLIDKISKELFIEECLNMYRNFIPKIALSNRTKQILAYFGSKYKLFLVSDGNLELQTRKFRSLNLDKYFSENNVFFTGINSSIYSKPKIKLLEKLDILAQISVFFGDRKIDEEFAKNSGMQFQKVYNMIGVD